MDITIHRVKRIRMSKLRDSNSGGKIRDILIEGEDEAFRLVLFGGEEHLQVRTSNSNYLYPWDKEEECEGPSPGHKRQGVGLSQCVRALKEGYREEVLGEDGRM